MSSTAPHEPPGRIESLTLRGAAGTLEALLNTGAAAAPFACLVCHPHPLYGGTMHNKVVFHAMKALNAVGLPVLRFNFRGAGSSAGVHDNGRGEVDDVRVALDYLSERFAQPLIFAGFSFGAAVGLRAATAHPAVAAMILLGAPLEAEGRRYSYAPLVECAKPKLLISGELDPYSSSTGRAQLFATLHEPKRLVTIAGADHFFTGHLHEMKLSITEWLHATILL